MKNFTLKLYRLCALAFLALLISCGDDDDNSVDTVVGNWIYTGNYYGVTKQFDPLDEECYIQTLSFKNTKDGVFTIIEDCDEIDYTSDFIWKKEKDTEIYSIKMDEDSQLLRIIFEAKNKMYIYVPGDSDAEVYERVLEE
jgi:hypothetical protein